MTGAPPIGELPEAARVPLRRQRAQIPQQAPEHRRPARRPVRGQSVTAALSSCPARRSALSLSGRPRLVCVTPGVSSQVNFRILLLGVGAALCSVPAAADRVLPGISSRTTPAAVERPAGLPADAELESAQAIIGTVTLQTRDLFDTERPEENTSLFRAANRLHMTTRDSTVRRQLLFKPGDRYQARLLEESARLLRDTRYLLDAQIRPVAWHDGVVDIEVTTQDVWTFNPGVSFGRKGGVSTSGFELEELNLLGRGTQLGVGFKSGVDRDSKIVSYRDRHLGSSWWDLAARYSDNSDGRLGELSLEHPFYALDTHNAGGVVLRDDRRVDSRYDLGQVVDQYETAARYASAYWGRSPGLHDGWVSRWSLGVTYDDRAFGPAPGAAAPLLLPTDRKLVYPWIAAELIEDDYRTARNRDKIEKTEDYSLGWRARAQLGYASESLASDRSALLFSGTLTKGLEFAERHTLLLEAHTTGRLEGGNLAGAVLGGEARYYLRQSPQRLLFLNVVADVGSNLDIDQQLLLGGDNGLRGYPLRYQAGTGRWLFTAEQRFFSDWYPFRLFNVGGAVFYDMGQTRGRDPLGAASQGLLKDIGFGLRLGGNRSAQANVLHIDVAFPLDGDSSIRKVQFLLETKHRF
jgi:hypothetical protein